jgi:hypothetical protein
VEINKSMKHRVKLFEYFEGDEADHLRDIGILGNTRYRYVLTGKVQGYKYESEKATEWRIRETMQTLGEHHDRTLEILNVEIGTKFVGEARYYTVMVDFTSELCPRDVGFVIYQDVSTFFYRRTYDYNKVKYND